jgi:hypothetical protein
MEAACRQAGTHCCWMCIEQRVVAQPLGFGHVARIRARVRDVHPRQREVARTRLSADEGASGVNLLARVPEYDHIFEYNDQ